jgi:hypothetical protein
MKISTKSILVLLLVCAGYGLQAQRLIDTELFKNKKELKVEVPEYYDLLKSEKQSSFGEYEFEHAPEVNAWEEAPIDKYYPRRGTRSFANIYLGFVNYLENGEQLPSSSELYNLNPLQSWYGGLSFDNITRMFGSVYLDWGIGGSVQEFSFENTRTRLDISEDAVIFFEDTDVRGKKSKIKMWHLNGHIVPTVSIGRYDSFRIGFGVYGGYRISSALIYKYNDANGAKRKDKNRGQNNLNQIRYGFRTTIGWNWFDLFVNYEMTDLFQESVEAPRLTPITFGFIF